MFSFLSNFFAKKGIDCFAPIPLADCSVVRPYLLERAGISDGTAILFAVPYFSSDSTLPRNLSAYSVPRDYHAYFKSLFEELLPQLRERFPQYRFAGFSDHSPIAEIEAACRAGLGVLGKNHLLITKRYASYVFLGEIITDARLECASQPIGYCSDCGACQAACPMTTHGGVCLSALTQKKGELTDGEIVYLREYSSVWGCDICQEVCPHTKQALKDKTIFSPIPYFLENTIPYLTKEILDAMTDEEFETRAYAWRTRAVISRNLDLLEMNDREEEHEDA
ncbi:MAG: epoxyqueuosine reductase [Clostridia bacterium]|nr:epoxyqueuosine reductase [Clostridia bacterium]